MSFFTGGKDKDGKKDDSLTVAKPITQQDNFCAELMEGAMDFTGLIEDLDGNPRQFIVAVSTGSRNKPQLLASTMRGPFEFYDMVEAVGSMWEREQHHAKVYLLTKSFDESSQFIDEGTVDYIEANWENIVASGILEAALMEDDVVPMIPAGLIVADPDEDE